MQIHLDFKEKVLVDSSIAMKLIDQLFKTQIDEKEFKKLSEYINEFEIQESSSKSSSCLI